MPFTEARKTLSARGWLGEQPQEFRDLLLDEAEFRTVPPSGTLYGLGESSGGIYGVANGFVDVLIAPGRLQPRLAHIGGPGWWVGEAGVATNSARRAGLVARTVVTFAYIGGSALTRLGKIDQEFWRRLSALTVQHLDDALSLAAVLGSDDLPLRISETLLRLTRLADDSAVVDLPITQAELAEIAGLSRNSLARLLAPLIEQGCVETGYRKISVDAGRLRATASAIRVFRVPT